MALSSDERDLIARAVRRDPEAFAQLYVQYYNPVFRRVWLIVRDRHEAEDIASEAFLRAWNAIPRFQERDVSILAWFNKIAERLALKQIKSQRPSMVFDDLVLSAPLEGNPDALMEQDADLAALKSAIQQLPTTQREIVSKHFLDEMTYPELGAIVGKPIGTVRVIQHRALKSLRTILMANKEQLNSHPPAKPTIPAKVVP